MMPTLLPEPRPATTRDVTRDVTRGLMHGLDVDAMAKSVHDAIVTSVFPEQAREPAFDVALSRCVHGNVRSVLDIASGRMSLEEADPRPALSFAGLVAELGIPFGRLERAYWVGVERLLQDWLELSRSVAGQGRNTVDGLVGEPVSAVFPYVRRVLDLVGDRYDAVTRERSLNGEDRRRDLVERLLSGHVPVHTQELDNILGYRLRGSHVALLFETGDRGVVRRELARLCERTGAWDSLAVQRGASTWSAWLGHPMKPDAARLARMRHALSALGERVAVGGPATGIAGVRQSHEEACRAARLRPLLAAPPDVIWYRDVRLEAFLLAEPDAARRFVAEELGELAEDGEREHKIRDTLLASLATGSHARAAADLGVHENTVRLRIRSATELLGEALTERRTELLVALRLRQALGAPEPSEATGARLRR